MPADDPTQTRRHVGRVGVKMGSICTLLKPSSCVHSAGPCRCLVWWRRRASVGKPRLQVTGT